MSRSRLSAPARRSHTLCVRLRPDEHAAFRRLAQTLGQPPSRVARRLIREAVTGGPDFFADGVLELRAASRELAAVGRNLNQLARAANRGAGLAGPEVSATLTAVRTRVNAVDRVYRAAVRAAVRRTVVPLGRAGEEHDATQ